MLGNGNNPKGRIILVEDSDAVRKSLTLMLRTSGYDVEGFKSAEDLLTSGAQADGQCLIIDYVLPQMNGIDLTVALRASGWTGPVILITGFYDVTLPPKARAVGVRKVLEKPLQAETILAALADL